jgi:hypothetical protein
LDRQGWFGDTNGRESSSRRWFVAEYGADGSQLDGGLQLPVPLLLSVRFGGRSKLPVSGSRVRQTLGTLKGEQRRRTTPDGRGGGCSLRARSGGELSISTAPGAWNEAADVCAGWRASGEKHLPQARWEATRQATWRRESGLDGRGSRVLAEHSRMTGARRGGAVDNRGKNSLRWPVGWMQQKRTTHGPEGEPRTLNGHKRSECARRSRRVNG